MIKKIIIALTLFLIVGLGLFLRDVNQEEWEQISKYEELSDKRRPLQVKKQELEQQLKTLEDNYEANKLPKGTTQVVFTGLEADVYNLCYPIMKKYEYTGTLAISLTQLPGMEGLMSVEQFKQLLSEGWDICIKWDSQTPVDSWWPELQKQMKQLQVKNCSVAYFTTGTYTKALDEQLEKMGFSIVVHHGEETDSLIQLSDEEGIWHLGAVGLMGEKPKLRLTEAIAQKGNITYLVGFELEDERYDERSFRSMLSYFDAYETNLELIVSNTVDARTHYHERQVVYEHAKEEEYNQARAVLEEELKKVEAELDAMDAQEE